jgi:hypothetical protein
MIRLVALDIDGTLVGHDLTYSPRVQTAVQRALAQGVIVTLATGRGAETTARFAAQLGLSAPLVCLQGGHICDATGHNALHDERLPPEAVPWIVARADERDWHLHFETAHMVYMHESAESPDALMKLFRVTRMKRVTNFLTHMHEVPHKFLVAVQTPEERDAVAETLRALVQAARLPIHVLPSHPILVEGLPEGVGKARGLEWLARYLNIGRDEVMAVGDNDNDISMLAWAGVGVAMGNASPGALAAADWVAPGVDEDGAALALEKYVLAG